MLEQMKGGGVGRALAHRDYRRFAGGDLVSLLGNWVQKVAVGWLTWKLTESGTWLGIIAIAELAPSLLLAPIGGALADKVDRLKIAIVTQAIMMGQAASLAVLTFGGWIDIWSLVALTGVRGCLNAWSHPARQALVPSLLPPDDLPAGIALSSVMFNTARFVGPALAGVIIAHGGIGQAFLFNTATFTVFLLAMATLKLPYRETITRKRQSLAAQLGEGFAYATRHPGIGPILALMLASALLVRPVADLLPGFSGAVFEAGASGLAWMTSVMGGGSMIAAFWLAQRGHVSGLTGLAMGGLAVAGLALVLFAVAPAFWTALVALTIASCAMTVTGISSQSLIQNAVESEFRGRVLAIYGVVFRAGPSIGALAIGSLSQAFGWHWPIAISSGLCFCLWLWGRNRQRSMTEALEGRPAVERPAAEAV